MGLIFVHLVLVYPCIDGAFKVLEGNFTHGKEDLMVWEIRLGPTVLALIEL